MTAPTTQPNDAHPFPGLWWTTTLAGCTAVFGFLLGARGGGFGPALMWIGGAVAAGSFLVDRALRVLPTRVHPPASTILAALGIAAQVAVIAFLMLEASARWQDTRPPPRWARQDELTDWHVPHEQLGWTGARNYTSTVELPSGPMQLTLNARGHRDIEQTVDPKRKRVVILGDSFPLSWGEPVSASTGPKLRAAVPEYQVFNAAWAGYAKDQIALSYAVHGQPLGASAVVFMFLAEPGTTGSFPLFAGRRKPWYELHDGQLHLLGLPLAFDATESNNRHIFREFEARTVGGLADAWHFLTHTAPQRHFACGPNLVPIYDWAAIERDGLPPMDPVELAILANLRKKLADDGVHLIVCLAPSTHVLSNTTDPVRAMRPYLDSLRAIGIEPIDLTKRIRGSWTQYYNAIGHPNGKGMDLVVPAIAARLRQLLDR